MNKINNISLPQGILKDVIEADDAILVIPDYSLDAFENSLGFYSLRKKLQDDEETLLFNGMNPQIYDVDTHFIQDDYLRTVINPALEIKISNSIFKYLNTIVRLKLFFLQKGIKLLDNQV